jgi:pimeloyl-ACP methyl ester carboxylesterase
VPLPLNTITWGDGPRSILLLHGITSNAAGWWRLGPALAEEGFTAVAADLRGHGHSPKSDDHSLAAYVADVLALRESWDAVLGHSVGGAVTTLASAERPEWSGTLILEDPAIVIPDLPAAITWLLADFEGDISADQMAARFPEWPRQDAEWKAEALRLCGPEVVELAFTQNDPWDLRAAVADLTVPTTIIGADPSGGTLIPTWFGDMLAENPVVTFTQVMGSHSMHRDRWDDFWTAVTAAL